MNAGWPGSCGFLPGSPREPSCPIISGPLLPRSFSRGDHGIPEATRDPERGPVPQGSKRRRAPLPAAPGRPVPPPSSSGSANLALEPGIFQKADLRVAQGTGPQTGRVGRVRAGPGPPPCSHPQRALTQMLRRAAGSPHPGITPATSPPGPRGAREGSRLRGRSDSEVGTGRTGFVHD